ncbi:MAG: zinc-ribbon domain-containing protein, partial [Aureibaculum sp.]
MKYCENCGSTLKKGSKFCTSCGAEIKATNLKEKEPIKSTKSITKEANTIDFNTINKRIRIQNSQSKIVKRSRYAAFLFFILMFLPFLEWSPFTGAWALAFISFFLVIVAIIVGYVFRSREKKLSTLISGEKLLAHWELSPELQKKYVDTLYQNEVQKNKGILMAVGIIAAVVFGLFILTIDEAQFFMFLVYIGLMVLMSIFAFAMPAYYRYQNRKNDAQILIGAKYA